MKELKKLPWNTFTWKIKLWVFLEDHPKIRSIIKTTFRFRCFLGVHHFKKRLWEFPENKSWLIEVHKCRDCYLEKENVLRRPPAETIILTPHVRIME